MSHAATRCPLCGRHNRCAQAGSPTPVQQCWCFAAPVAREALAHLPAAQRNRACLCPGCAQGLPPAPPDHTATGPD
ncbi:cysteine-rich CWC family protein [Pseudomonas lalucatii]|uniref:Cysteine-rich CWC family protein n=1 Tax=Pseudomonas lalucatii TaxID=1424203 RepID=A0ABS5PZ22_9PSED|nr:cysteine-rich CWC family protein [Pseudomonas lalucatii]MBS7661564.1 cysteine-rich CWC family protein [Pseudomonas lalucatii]MBS7723999.1 cysteine-rich CWC family protein [Pseudomonas lalucatii]QVM87998.1 cysteine-rich CWC family protein [Pseudomonas lalucatii]